MADTASQVQIDGAAPLYGGPRLQPAHFEPAHVPIEIARYGNQAHTLSVGSPGKVGILELGFELCGVEGRRRTELVHHFQKSPLQIMKPLYYNPLRPDMPYTYILTTGGGILHNDRQRTDLSFGPGTSAHVTTQAHTKVYRMESGYATALTNIDIGEGAYVEYLPDPLIPFRDSRYFQRLAVTLHEGASLVIGDVVYAGRLTRGEHHAYAAYAADFEVRRPDGTPLAFDRIRLVPGDRRLSGPSVVGDRDIVCSLYVFSPMVPADQIADRLHEAAAAVIAGSDDETSRFGVSLLPADHGAWLRYVGDDTITALAVQSAVSAAAHELLTGNPAPAIRK